MKITTKILKITCTLKTWRPICHLLRWIWGKLEKAVFMQREAILTKNFAFFGLFNSICSYKRIYSMLYLGGKSPFFGPCTFSTFLSEGETLNRWRNVVKVMDDPPDQHHLLPPSKPCHYAITTTPPLLLLNPNWPHLFNGLQTPQFVLPDTTSSLLLISDDGDDWQSLWLLCWLLVWFESLMIGINKKKPLLYRCCLEL